MGELTLYPSILFNTHSPICSRDCEIEVRPARDYYERLPSKGGVSYTTLRRYLVERWPSGRVARLIIWWSFSQVTHGFESHPLRFSIDFLSV